MRYISATWRADYVRQAVPVKGCIFCQALKGRDDRATGLLLRGRRNFVMLNRYPYTPGHLMIAPRRHLADFAAAGPAERAELAELLRTALLVLRRAYGPQGFNAGMNLGASAGAGVAGHYHLHVVPRWTGDSNFMPLVGGTRVFIEDLDTTYRKLRPLFHPERRRGSR
ncbi:MAG TPA: HIT domain-containing protein [Candidatus Aminicenantes bacterium]|nr:HIT domain-containing protein [Candidatus Aminicenantes bacterium]HRY64727.1 HIT domain-containing protein [Candidatus Aminicenantes bacterium]HRZ71640.1 HIT domain-containing protein [Candidatus Aminicenantes bacterium]